MSETYFDQGGLTKLKKIRHFGPKKAAILDLIPSGKKVPNISDVHPINSLSWSLKLSFDTKFDHGEFELHKTINFLLGLPSKVEKKTVLIQNIAFLLHFEVNRSKMSIVVYNQNSPCTNLVSKESFRLQDKGLFGWTSEILGTFLPEGLKSKMAAIFGPKSSIFPNFVSPP